jgi:hypothetical protein
MTRVLVGAWLLLSGAGAWGQTERPDVLRRQTIRGVQERAAERLEIVNRGNEMMRENDGRGAAGRRNATQGAARQAAQPSLPSMLPPTLREF